MTKDNKPTLVITTINAPNNIMKELAVGAARADWRFIIIGDSKTPPYFHLENSEYYNLDAQRQLGFLYAELCPIKHYARKNIGYLSAIKLGAPLIIETDDDNIPLPEFFASRTRDITAQITKKNGWVNIYQYFSDENIWPRGLPLEEIKSPNARDNFDDLPVKLLNCPIQQGLANDNPDVDAVYRLTQKLPIMFEDNKKIILNSGSFCPFNSQNTSWWPEAFPLLYLPAYCSFRMTDIWRSFVAMRIAASYGWGILFHSPTVRQERNEHNLLRDFEEEIPGYLQNNRIMATLNRLILSDNPINMNDNIVKCYRALVADGIFEVRELALLEAWLKDLA